MGGIETDQNCETRIKGLSPWVNVPLLVCTVQTVWVLIPGGTGGLRPSGR